MDLCKVREIQVKHSALLRILRGALPYCAASLSSGSIVEHQGDKLICLQVYPVLSGTDLRSSFHHGEGAESYGG